MVMGLVRTRDKAGAAMGSSSYVDRIQPEAHSSSTHFSNTKSRISDYSSRSRSSKKQRRRKLTTIVNRMQAAPAAEHSTIQTHCGVLPLQIPLLLPLLPLTQHFIPVTAVSSQKSRLHLRNTNHRRLSPPSTTLIIRLYHHDLFPQKTSPTSQESKS